MSARTDLARTIDMMERESNWLSDRSYDGPIYNGGRGPLAVAAMKIDFEIGTWEREHGVRRYCAPKSDGPIGGEAV